MFRRVTDSQRQNFLQFMVSNRILPMLDDPNSEKEGYIQRRRNLLQIAKNAQTPPSIYTARSEPVTPPAEVSTSSGSTSDTSASQDSLVAPTKTQQKKLLRAQRKREAEAQVQKNKEEAAAAQMPEMPPTDMSQSAGSSKSEATSDQDNAPPTIATVESTHQLAEDARVTNEDGSLVISAIKAPLTVLFSVGSKVVTTYSSWKHGYDSEEHTLAKIKLAEECVADMRLAVKDVQFTELTLAADLKKFAAVLEAAKAKVDEERMKISASEAEYEEVLRTMKEIMKWYDEKEVKEPLKVIMSYDHDLVSKSAEDDACKKFFSNMFRIAFDIWFDEKRTTGKSLVAYDRKLPKEQGEIIKTAIFERISDYDNFAKLQKDPAARLRQLKIEVRAMLDLVKEQQAALTYTGFGYTTTNEFLDDVIKFLNDSLKRLQAQNSNSNSNQFKLAVG